MEQQQSLHDLTPSAKLIYKILEYDDMLTQKQLIDESLLSPRTVRYALDDLEKTGYVEERVHPKDARKSLYKLVKEANEHNGDEAKKQPQSV